MIEEVTKYDDPMYNALEATNQIGIPATDKALREFMESPHALYIWLRQTDGTFTRGNPGKLPYEVTRDPRKMTPASIAYWKHYNLNPIAPSYHGFMNG